MEQLEPTGGNPPQHHRGARALRTRLELLMHLPRAGDVVEGHADTLHLAADPRADRAGAVAARWPADLVRRCGGARFLDGAAVGERPSRAGAERRLAMASPMPMAVAWKCR